MTAYSILDILWNSYISLVAYENGLVKALWRLNISVFTLYLWQSFKVTMRLQHKTPTLLVRRAVAYCVFYALDVGDPQRPRCALGADAHAWGAPRAHRLSLWVRTARGWRTEAPVLSARDVTMSLPVPPAETPRAESGHLTSAAQHTQPHDARGKERAGGTAKHFPGEHRPAFKWWETRLWFYIWCQVVIRLLERCAITQILSTIKYTKMIM